MLSLLLSVALATTTPTTPSPLAETARKVNALLPEQDKFIIPSQGSRLLYDRIITFKTTGSKSDVTKNVLKIASMSLQGCNAYSTETMVPHISEFNVGINTAIDQVSKEGDLKKAQSLAHLSLMVTQCKGPMILNMLGLQWLQKSVQSLKAINHRKLKKDDKMRMQALKEQILGLNTQEILQDTMRFEVLSATALLTSAMNSPINGEAKEPMAADNYEVWMNLIQGKAFVANWDDLSKITVDILKTVNKPSSAVFPEYHAVIAKQSDEGFKRLWTILDLKNHGFEKVDDLKNDEKFKAWLVGLNNDPSLAAEVNKKLTADPQVSTAVFQISLPTVEVGLEALQKFDAKLKELQKVTSTLAK